MRKILCFSLLVCWLAGGVDSAEVVVWTPAYGVSDWQSALLGDWGGTNAPRHTYTRICAQFWLPQTNGSGAIITNELVGSSEVTWLRDYCSANGQKFLLTVYNYYDVGGWRWDVARDAFGTNKEAFAASLVDLCTAVGADGIDVDLEGDGDLDSDREAFAAFVQTLGTNLHARGKLLTIDSFAYIWNAPNISWWGDWLGYVDAINVMGYTETWQGAAESWRRYSTIYQYGRDLGYTNREIVLGLAGYSDNWGSGGRGTTPWEHVAECRYDTGAGRPAGVAIWDARLMTEGGVAATNWQNAVIWTALHGLKLDNGGHGAGAAVVGANYLLLLGAP